MTIQKGSIAKSSEDLEVIVLPSEVMHSQVWDLGSRVIYLSEGRWLLSMLDFSVREGHQDISGPLESKQWAGGKPLISIALSQYWIIYYCSLASIIQYLISPHQRRHSLGKSLSPEYFSYLIYQTENKTKQNIFSGCKNSVVLYLQFFGYSWSWKYFATAQLYTETSHLSERINNCRKFGIC